MKKKRWKALQDAEKMLLDDAVIAPVFQRGLSYLQKAVCERFIRTSIWTSNKFKVGRCTKIKDEKTDSTFVVVCFLVKVG